MSLISLNDIVKKEKKCIKSNEDFIKWSKLIHGENTFIYDFVIFNGCKKKIKLKCKNDHEFLVTINSHIHKKSGCRKCANKLNGIKFMENAKNRFIENAKKIHGDLYDYSEIDYKGSHINIKVKCINGHIFLIQPNVHLSVGQGCKFCNEELKKSGEKILNKKPRAMTIKWDTDKFIEESKKIHGNKYCYDFTVFESMKKKIVIKCGFNHIFKTYPYTHLGGSNCAECTNNKITNNEFIKKSIKIFGDNVFDYSKVEYKGVYKKINLFCIKNNHSLFLTPNSHYKSLGCNMCKNTSEKILFDKLKSVYNSLSFQKYFREINEIKNYPFDYFLEEFKIIIELDGDQHFKEVKIFKGQTVEERQRVDFIKMYHLSKIGYSIIRIYQPNLKLKTFEWFELIIKSINYIKKQQKSFLITIVKNKKIYNNYINNYKKFLEEENDIFKNDYFVENIKDINIENNEN